MQADRQANLADSRVCKGCIQVQQQQQQRDVMTLIIDRQTAVRAQTCTRHVAAYRGEREEEEAAAAAAAAFFWIRPLHTATVSL